QQVHPLLSASRYRLQHRPQQEFISGKSFGRFEPLVQTRAHRQSSQGLRALWWRRPRPRRSDLLRSQPKRSRPQSRARDSRGVARQRPPAKLRREAPYQGIASAIPQVPQTQESSPVGASELSPALHSLRKNSDSDGFWEGHGFSRAIK